MLPKPLVGSVGGPILVEGRLWGVVAVSSAAAAPHPADTERRLLAYTELALRGLARRAAVPVELEIGVSGRLPERVEVAAYYVVSEALANAAKHARASFVEVEVAVSDGVLRLLVSEDGVGGAQM